MEASITTRIGWPMRYQPRSVKPKQEEPKLDRLGKQLYHDLKRLQRDAAPGLVSEATIALFRLLPGHGPAEITRETIAATTRFSAEAIEMVLDILENEAIDRLACQIEKKAAILMDKVFCLPADFMSAARLNHADVISNEMFEFLIERLELLNYLKPKEFNDIFLMDKLREDDAFYQKFIEKRKTEKLLVKDSEITNCLADCDRLVGLINVGETYYCSAGELLSRLFFGSPLWPEMFRKTTSMERIDKVLLHDIRNAFVPGLMEGKKIGKDNLFLKLHGLLHLRDHLGHVRSVLLTNKYRLDGKLPAQAKQSLAAIARTAANAASYRVALPFNETAPAKAGHVNLLVKNDKQIKIMAPFLELILYNLFKNSFNAVRYSGKKHGELEITAKVEAAEQSPDVMTISVEDNCLGFQLEILLKAGKEYLNDLIKAEDFEEIDRHPALHKLKQWQKLPDVLRTFTVGEILDLVFLAKISGYGSNAISSGLGMDEVAELAELINADILITNKFNGNALVTIIIGEKAQRDKVIARRLGQTT